MSHARLPLKVRPVPGGFAIIFADGRVPIVVYGREKRVASATHALTLDEAREVAQEIAQALEAAWSQSPRGLFLRRRGKRENQSLTRAQRRLNTDNRRRTAIIFGIAVGIVLIGAFVQFFWR